MWLLFLKSQKWKSKKFKSKSRFAACWMVEEASFYLIAWKLVCKRVSLARKWQKKTINGIVNSLWVWLILLIPKSFERKMLFFHLCLSSKVLMNNFLRLSFQNIPILKRLANLYLGNIKRGNSCFELKSHQIRKIFFTLHTNMRNIFMFEKTKGM